MVSVIIVYLATQIANIVFTQKKKNCRDNKRKVKRMARSEHMLSETNKAIEDVLKQTIPLLKKGKKIQIEYNKHANQLNVLICNMKKIDLESR